MKTHLAVLGLLAAVALLAASATASATRAGVAAPRAAAQRYTGTIAFLRGPPDASKISQSLYVVHPDGSGLHRLTPPELSVYNYAWSPDGSKIAFIDAHHYSLWLVHPNGTGLRQLLSGSKQASVDLSWSPDGTRIAIASLGPNASVQTATCAGLPIYLVPVDGTAPTAVRGASAGCSVAWSPRGSEIAYEGRGGVWVVRPDGSGRRQVSPTGGGWVRWSADGKKLAFSVAITKHGRVTGRYRGIGDTDANGKRHRLITRRADNEYPAAWSPLGRRILYGRTNAGGGIYTIRGDGRNALRVTNDSPPGSEWPALGWSPNARAIVYTTPTNNGDLYIAGANGRGKVQLTNTADFDNSPSWVANELAATTHGGRAAAAPTGGGTGRSSGPSVPLASLPDGNGAQAFAFDRRFPNIVYIASARASGGVYVFKTIDGGQHWRSTGAHGMGWESDILSLTIDPRHRATLYAGTDTAVYKTTNGGRSWRPFKQGLFPRPHKFCYSTVIGRQQCRNYRYSGTPGKTNWNRGNGWVLDVAVDPIHSNVVYAATDAVRKSTDGGHTWRAVFVPPRWKHHDIARITIAPTRPESIYAIAHGNDAGATAIYKSTDAGRTWRATGSGLPASCCWDSEDALAVDPGNPKELYAVVGNTVLATTNGGASWHPKTNGLPANEVTSLAANPGRSGTVYASSIVDLNHVDTGGVYQPAGAIYETTDSGQTWTAVFSSIGVGKIAVDPGRPSTIYATGWAPSDQTHDYKMHLLRSTDAGHTWAISP